MRLQPGKTCEPISDEVNLTWSCDDHRVAGSSCTPLCTSSGMVANDSSMTCRVSDQQWDPNPKNFQCLPNQDKKLKQAVLCIVAVIVAAVVVVLVLSFLVKKMRTNKSSGEKHAGSVGTILVFLSLFYLS